MDVLLLILVALTLALILYALIKLRQTWASMRTDLNSANSARSEAEKRVSALEAENRALVQAKTDLETRMKAYEPLIPENARLVGDLANLSRALDESRERTKQLEPLQAENAKLRTESRQMEDKLKLLQDAEDRLKKEFENLANRIFNERGNALTEQGKQKVDAVLQPLKEQLAAFLDRVNKVHNEETNQSATLLTKVEDLQKLSVQVSQDANNLATAIKGNNKVQGGWGELVVKRLLEESGMIEGIHFDSQKSITLPDGNKLIPDFVINLPDDRYVVLDSKVSLSDFDDFCKATAPAEADDALKKHVVSVKKHMKGLAEKHYDRLMPDKSLDFVIMCIPIEPAFQAAYQHDQNLIYSSEGGKVLATGPLTLLLMLKLIAQFWRRDSEVKNTRDISRRAVLIYDQVRLVAEAIEKSKEHADEVSKFITLSLDRLACGQGNLIDQIEKMRKLGLDVKKQLPKRLVELADGDSHDETGDASEEASEATALESVESTAAEDPESVSESTNAG